MFTRSADKDSNKEFLEELRLLSLSLLGYRPISSYWPITDSRLSIRPYVSETTRRRNMHWPKTFLWEREHRENEHFMFPKLGK